MLRNTTVFAWKIITPFANWTREDLLNEVRAIDSLSANEISEKLVLIIQHGSLPDSPFYYIDMEFCEDNLERYIKGRYSELIEKSLNPPFGLGV